MEVKKIVEGMTAVEVAEVIDSNFKNQNKILEEDIATQNSVIGVSEYKDFSEAEAVSVGDVRKYNGFLYECVEATTGAFDASKWKKSSFKAETEKKLTELGSKVMIKDLSQIDEEKGALSNSGWYHFNSNGYHKAIQVSSDSYEKLCVLSNYDASIGFLKEYNPPYVNGSTIPYVSGTGLVNITAGNKTILNIPNGTSYIAFTTKDGGGNIISYSYIELLPSEGLLAKCLSDIISISEVLSNVNLESGSISKDGANSISKTLRNREYVKVFGDNLYFFQDTKDKDYYYEVCLACYDSDKEFIGRVEWTKNYELKILDGTSYVRVILSKYDKNTGSEFELTTSDFNKHELYIGEKPYQFDYVSNLIERENKLDISLLERGSISNTDGSNIKNDKALRSKCFLKVDSLNIKIHKNTEEKSYYYENLISCYDSNFEFIGRTAWTKDTEIKLFEGTKYIKFVIAQYNKVTKEEQVVELDNVPFSLSEGDGGSFLKSTNKSLLNNVNRLLYNTLESGTIWNDGTLHESTSTLRSTIMFPINETYIYLGQDTDTKDYYYQFAVVCYDVDMQVLGRLGWSRNIQRELLPNTRYVRMVVLRSSKADNSDLDFSLSDLKDNEFYEGFRALLPKSESYNHTYKGNRIEIDNAVNIRTLFTMTHEFDYSLRANQACAIYGNYLFQFLNANARVAIYDMISHSLIATIENDEIPLLHNNGAAFGIVKYDNSDLFPLIYLSGGNENDCYVFRFVGESIGNLKMEIVQHITCNVSNLYYSNYMIDANRNQMVLFGYYGTTTDDQSYGVVVNVPNLELSEYQITDSDVIDTFKGEYHLIQDSKCYSSKIYVITGLTNTAELSVYDKNHALINRISLVDLGITSEPEGVAVYNGKLIVVTLHGTVFELSFR